MRLDHLLSREKAGRETGRLIPRSIVASQGAMEKKGPKGPKADSVLPVHSVSFSGFVEGNGPTQAPPGTHFKRSGKPVREVGRGHSPRTLTTAYERKDEIKRLVISVQFNDANHWARKDWS